MAVLYLGPNQTSIFLAYLHHLAVDYFLKKALLYKSSRYASKKYENVLTQMFRYNRADKGVQKEVNFTCTR